MIRVAAGASCRSECFGNGCVGQVVRIAREFLNIDLADRRLIRSGSGTGDEPDERSKAKDLNEAQAPSRPRDAAREHPPVRVQRLISVVSE